MKVSVDSNIVVADRVKTERMNLKSIINVLLDLGKFKITFFVALSAATGFYLFSSSLNYHLLYATTGLFLVAFGSAALNHFQEHKTDKMMKRTLGRPIPSGRVSRFTVLAMVILTVVSGSALLYYFGNIQTVILGVFTLVWYNFIYTPLKKVSAYAVIPGALIGALPPIVGWSAAGGEIFDPVILTFGAFLFIWQVPHFWLLMMIYGKEYTTAGLPSITEKFSREKLSRINFVMNLVLGFSSYFLIMFNVINSVIGMAALAAAFLFLIISTKVLLNNIISDRIVKRTFMFLNAYVLLVVLTIIFEKAVTVF
ncbi:MAG: protoheme IX farnesyltransferase [Rhodothermaceae bacterium]